MKTIASDLLRFQEEESENDTAVVTVLAKSKGVILGQIRWFKDYRCYVFYPGMETKFNHRALGDITTQLVSMMDEWAKAAGRKPTHGTSSPYRPRARRCNAPGPREYERCGRWLGHDGPHRQMGSTETWDAWQRAKLKAKSQIPNQSLTAVIESLIAQWLAMEGWRTTPSEALKRAIWDASQIPDEALPPKAPFVKNA